MNEVVADPFPDMWQNMKHTLGFDIESPAGGVECIQHAVGVVPMIRQGVGRVMDLGSVDK